MLRLLALGALLLGTAAHAAKDCPPNGVSLFPRPGSVVPTNGRFVMEGLGEETQRVASLVGKKMTLASTEDRVSVRVEKGWSSAHGRTAVVLVPQTPLLPDRPYTLLLEESLGGARVLNADPASKAARWRAGKGPDQSSPKWVKRPAPTSGEYDVDDGKLSRAITFALELEEDSPAYLVVSLRRARGSTAVQTYFVPVMGGEAKVGHDGCSGGFIFEDGRAYRARIDAFDVAGNAAAKLPILEFQAPRQESR